MSVLGVADQFMILTAFTLLFTVLSLAYKREIILSLLSAISWLTFGLAWFAIGDKTSSLTMSIPWLFFAVGIVFTVHAVRLTFEMWSEKRTWR